MNQISLEDFKDANETFEDGIIMTDRYNTLTYDENIKYRMRYEYECLYGSPHKIKHIELGSPIYMIEMNNTTNSIEGIGYFYNTPLTNIPEICSDVNYKEWNNNIYGGEYHITRDDFNKLFPEILIPLEKKLFKGRGNSKRGKGFTKLSNNVYFENIFTEEILLSAIQTVFIHKYF